MTSPLKLITPPSIEPLMLADVKLYLRVDHNDDDVVIARTFSAALAYTDGEEGFLGRALVDQTWELTIDAFPVREIQIPLPPLIAISNIFYDDGAGVQQILDPSKYSVDAVGEAAWVLPVGSWPATFVGMNAVRIRFRAGYVDTSFSPPVGKVPEDIVQALLLLTGTMYDDRATHIVGQTVTQSPWSAEQLLRRRRVEIPFA